MHVGVHTYANWPGLGILARPQGTLHARMPARAHIGITGINSHQEP